MRFFTMEWWRAVQSGSNDNPSDAYERHLALLRPLPAAVAAMDQVPSLHDARFNGLDHVRDSVVVRLDRWGERGGWVAIQLRYGGVEQLIVSSEPDGGLPGPNGFGDLGYYELDLATPDLYEHRLLFSSGIELAIRFRSFVFASPPDGASRVR
jgi:hypothetical protein